VRLLEELRGRLGVLHRMREGGDDEGTCRWKGTCDGECDDLVGDGAGVELREGGGVRGTRKGRREMDPRRLGRLGTDFFIPRYPYSLSIGSETMLVYLHCDS
jgi:hypothetical protein